MVKELQFKDLACMVLLLYNGRTKDQNVIAFGPMKCYVNEKLTGRILFSSNVNDTAFVITSR